MRNIRLHIWLFSMVMLGNIMAQTREILLPETAELIRESRYSTVQTLDLRYDSLDNGAILHNGKKVQVIFASPLRKQLERFLSSVTESDRAKGTVLFALRKLKLVERNDIDFEYGYLFFRATVFSVEGNNTYRRLRDADTLIELKEREVSDSLLTEAGRSITTLLLRSLYVESTDRPEYTYFDLTHLDEHEKRIMPVYTVKTFVNGVYLSWNSFKNQTPDHQILNVSYKWNGAARFKVKTKEGRTIKLSGNDIYGFVDKEVPYVFTDAGTCIVERKNGDLFYAFKGKLNSMNEEYALPPTMAESLGKNTASAIGASGISGTNGCFISRIDHVDGSFMRIKKLR